MKRILVCLLAVVSWGWLNAFADQKDTRLDALFTRLKASQDIVESRAIEVQIWNIWTDSGRQDVNEMMQRGLDAMGSRRLDEALTIFDQIVQTLPNFAEGWNKRATVYYLKNDYAESVKDVQRTLALEPRHFGAISGMGLIFMEVGDEVGAVKAFEDVLKLYPQSPGAQGNIERLKEKIRKEMI
jgi:tetratricopeptide (TPR) repeat protein